MKALLCIGIGGFLGAIARYGLGAVVHAIEGGRTGGFPVGTLAVNLLGCLLLGFCAHLITVRFVIAHEIGMGLTVGFLGAFTTFSTFAHETLLLARHGAMMMMWLNVIASNTLGLAAVWAGYRLGGLV